MGNNQKAKRSAYNLLSAIVSEIIIVALGLMVPRLVLVNYGSEINGLLNSVTQITTYLTLLEAGVGTATLQALYGPVARGNKDDICGIMSATSRFYKRTGTIYGVILIAVALLYPYFVKTDLSYKLIFAVIILNGSASVFSYFLTAKYGLLLQAEGKTYISTNLTTVSQILISLSKVILILLGFNVIMVQVAYFTVSLIRIAYLLIYIRRHYKWLNLRVKPNYGAISQSKSVLVHQIAGMVFEQTDITVLSVLVGLKSVSVYSMYSMVYGMILTLVRTVPSSFTFILGQAFNTDRKNYLKLLDIYEVYYMAITFALMTITCVLCLPFLELYTAGVEDINYINRALPYLFTLIYLLNNARSSSNMTINCAQHFRKTQYRALLEAIINLSVSIICCFKFGIYGVLFGTIAALFYRTNDVILYSNRKILKRNPLITYKRWIIYFATFIFVMLLFNQFSPDMSNYFLLIKWAVFYTLAICAIYLGVAIVSEPRVFQSALGYLKAHLKKR